MQVGQAFQLFQIVRQVFSLGVAVMLAQLLFTTESIGNYELWLWLASLFSIFILNGLLQNLLSRSDILPKTQAGTFTIVVLLSLIYGLILWVFPNVDSLLTRQQLLFDQNFAFGIIGHLTGLLIPYLLLIQKRKTTLIYYSAIYIITGISVYGYYCLGSVEAVQISKAFLLFSTLNGLVCLAFLIQFIVKNGIDFSAGISVFLTAWPLILGSIAAMGSTIVDDYLVNTFFVSASVFAIWRYGAREVPLLGTLASAFSNQKLTVFRPKNLEDQSDLRNQTKRFLSWVFPLCIALITAAPYLFDLVFGQSFKTSVPIFQLYVFLMLSRFVFPQIILLTNQLRKRILLVSFIELIINVILSIWWVRLFGLLGIAAATVVAYYCEKILLVIFVYYDCNVKPNTYIPIFRFLLFVSVVLILLIWIQQVQ